jgi:hypothetical protein
MNSQISNIVKWENSKAKSDIQIHSILFKINDIDYI